VNDGNLMPFKVRSGREARERGRAGGTASGAARRKRATMREALRALMAGKLSKAAPFYAPTRELLRAFGIKGEPCGLDAVVAAVFDRAAKGDVLAATFIRDTAGEKPSDVFVDATPPPPVVLGLFDPARTAARAAKQEAERTAADAEAGEIGA